MPFGKHRGTAISELADEYLLWLTSIELRRPWLRDAVEEEIERRRLDEERREEERRETFDRLNAPQPEVADAIVGAGLRSLARRHHPDVGGDGRRMSELNNAADWLRQQVRALA